ncbi:UDP-N-acetylmuramoyl-L-alanine--D-glutamate ligase [Candidatus Falkowbacteria bacterium]|jgi:UDP-N-acetylmuramoylalanine--D-glutamate ligase|nr:UDP-N-acetylmuramoyl-L-alanine--D-glutamate ligase [Candidatus Falkowbacteria bacterium]MBT6573584.1 UDP-N-acetylmuramoyl-L-alanine--D-glutamate ligase [Candidatus Falkowbacteria bacterium]MBT7500654.1 UDP-N-acetylmuramoyl-L-alanine--D-glutamate ligase [Candidatus Falkowbacteria bacterium]
MPNKTLPNYKNKKILILGLGLLGRGLKDAIFFAEKGAQVTVTDLKTAEELETSLEKLKPYSNIKYTLEEHKEEDILSADLIIRNAGIPLKSPFLKLAFKNNIPVDMDESLFAEYCPCPIIGITGTRGKSTTTTIIGQMLQKIWANEKRNVYISGNLQGEATLPLINQVTKNDLVVLELSSWQLQGFGWKKISPHIAVFTNIFPDHLNSYKSMREYINDKKLIFQNQKKSDYCLINAENNYTKKISSEIKSKTINFHKKDVPASWKLKVDGAHNLENLSAALAVGKILGFTKKHMRDSIEAFSGIEHRLEKVGTVNDIKFINDTTSTTPIAGKMALNSVEPPVILLAGGATKNLNLTEFARTIVKKVKVVVLLEGSATDELEKKIIKYGGKNIIAGRYNDFKKAIEHAYSLSLPGDTILLSPGCASFGMFINEFDRGEQFKTFVKQLK